MKSFFLVKWSIISVYCEGSLIMRISELLVSVFEITDFFGFRIFQFKNSLMIIHFKDHISCQLLKAIDIFIYL